MRQVTNKFTEAVLAQEDVARHMQEPGARARFDGYLERQRVRVRNRVVLRYYARTIQHLMPHRRSTP